MPVYYEGTNVEEAVSATVYWRPVQPKKGKSLDGQSTFMNTLQRAFNDGDDGPVFLYHKDEPALRAMAAATTRFDDPDKDDNDYITLADALEHHDCIEVWAEY